MENILDYMYLYMLCWLVALTVCYAISVCAQRFTFLIFMQVYAFDEFTHSTSFFTSMDDVYGCVCVAAFVFVLKFFPLFFPSFFRSSFTSGKYCINKYMSKHTPTFELCVSTVYTQTDQKKSNQKKKLDFFCCVYVKISDKKSVEKL